MGSKDWRYCYQASAAVLIGVTILLGVWPQSSSPQQRATAIDQAPKLPQSVVVADAYSSLRSPISSTQPTEVDSRDDPSLKLIQSDDVQDDPSPSPASIDSLGPELEPRGDDWIHRCQADVIFATHMNATTNHLAEVLNHQKESVPTLLWIGCSIDRHQFEFVCNLADGYLQHVPYNPEITPEEEFLPSVCLSDRLHLAFFDIFGMHRRCNTEFAEQSDRRHFTTTADRLRVLLPELLDMLPQPPTHVQIGSNLWDLSDGCNNEPTVTEAYKKEYVQGMYEITAALDNLLSPDTLRYWRTALPIHQHYSRKIKRHNGGRTLKNQRVLNRLVHQTVADAQLGQVVDLWSVVKAAPTDCCMVSRYDGRHYPACPSYTFVNTWLDAIYQ